MSYLLIGGVVLAGGLLWYFIFRTAMRDPNAGNSMSQDRFEGGGLRDRA